MTNSQSTNDVLHAEAAALAAHIQHTIISNVLTESSWETHIAECLRFGFNAAMVPGAWVKRTAERLRGSKIRVASFIDFPYGTMTRAGKACEARNLVDDGAQEIDLMPNVGYLLSGMEKDYRDDIAGVVKAAGNVPVKIMLELPLLNEQQQNRAVALSIEAGVAYLKNASGGAVGVALPEQIRFLRQLAPPHIRVKASGGIKTARQLRDLLAAGADLAGTSSGVRIIQEVLHQDSAVSQPVSNY
ncbi:MAG TPA: deoxyribose-phosphate aldolase [Candidatus Acidoferrales bacterium]|nr:deoxyribose-phosphate aldolase [Candidatus Acidoferrales bacterium]